MISVNINKSGATAATEAQIRNAACGAWILSEQSAQLFADYLVAVRKNVVVGAWTIDSYERDEDDKVTFDLSPAPQFGDLIGEPSPVAWVQGQANPVKLVDTETLRQESSDVELTPQGNRRVRLDGWTLIVYPDGRARVQPPDNTGKLIVESAFPGPKGGNVTVRVIGE